MILQSYDGTENGDLCVQSSHLQQPQYPHSYAIKIQVLGKQ